MKSKQTKPTLVLDELHLSDLEKELEAIGAEYKIREIDVTFKKEKFFFGKVKNSGDLASFFRFSILPKIEVQEHFMAIFLSSNSEIIGYYLHSIGSLTQTLVDTQLLTATALKVLAKFVVICHNHPSGNLRPSEPDRKLTNLLKESLSIFNIHLIDHIIITKDSYMSFADQGDLSLSGLDDDSSELRVEILKELKKVTKANSPNLYEILATKEGYLGIEEQVLRKVLQTSLIPSAIIPQLEQELEML